jgi:hypothetical protein
MTSILFEILFVVFHHGGSVKVHNVVPSPNSFAISAPIEGSGGRLLQCMCESITQRAQLNL